MSILIDRNSRVITQGITGKTGQFHTRMGIQYANGKNCYVAGVTPKKGGQTFEGVPIYERFFLGDEYTIRGYNLRSISPIVPLELFVTSRNVVVATNASGGYVVTFQT